MSVCFLFFLNSTSGLTEARLNATHTNKPPTSRLSKGPEDLGPGPLNVVGNSYKFDNYTQIILKFKNIY